MNNCVLSGNLTRDPEVRTFAAGSSVTRFAIAVNNRRKNKSTGEYENEPAFVDCQAWAKTGEFVSKNFQKGDVIVVVGEIRQENWETAEGQKRAAEAFKKYLSSDPKGDPERAQIEMIVRSAGL